MIELCGNNNKYQLGKISNTEIMYSSFTITPVHSSFDISSISSLSICGDHSVAIIKNGTILATGNNNKGEIYPSIPQVTLTGFTSFEIRDEHNNLLHPISASCGYNFTVYLVSLEKGSNENRLALSYSYIKTDTPLFLNTGKSNPVALFSGFTKAAAIDSDGKVLFDLHTFSEKRTTQLEAVSLPDGDKAVKVACCSVSFFVLGLSGRLFEVEPDEFELEFNEVEELHGEKIVDVSGIYDHCLALTENGTVFGFGSNKYGKLGLGENIEETSVFTEISSLNQITAVCAGTNHSLFQTSEGKVFACGYNKFGELFTDSPTEDVLTPIEVKLKGKATFCIAGDSKSAIFIGHDPINSPNHLIGFKKLNQPQNKSELRYEKLNFFVKEK